ncbi:MAG TPA: hypothetical protein VEI04_03565 [Syntrophobacteria bacterium]|nr:hypothetical protein [Syntrophobacteria bacterium]
MRVTYKAILPLTVLALALMGTVSAHSAEKTEKTITGTLVGVTTVMGGHQYSRDMMVAHAAFEPDFVLLVNPQEHYMLGNVPREVKVKYAGEEIRITGGLNPQKTAITVNTLAVKQGNTYKEVWTAEMQRKAWEEREKYEWRGGGA